MFKFPFGTMNELNLDWIITKVRELIDTAGTTKEKITFETSNGDVQFDGSEAVTIDVQGVDTSGKLDKYTGGTNTLYATLGQNQANIPLPLPADYGGTGCTSLADLEIAMGLPNSYVARDTSAGLYAYGHDGSNERTIPVEISPNPAGIPYRDVNGNVRTNTPDNDKDAANKEYVDVQSRRIDDVTNTTHSLSGATVTLTDGVLGAPLKSCVATITPVQAGSGDPSPTNIRSISGWSAANLYREAAYSASATPYCTVQFGDTYYGGQYNYLTGLLTVTHAFREFDGTEAWAVAGSGTSNRYFLAFATGFDMVRTDVISSHYGYYQIWLDGNSADWGITVLGTSMIKFLDGNNQKTLSTFKQWLADQKTNGTPVQFCWKLATPYTVQLTPQEVTLLADSNTIWADCGDVSIEYGGYIGSLEDAIARLTARVAALENA